MDGAMRDMCGAAVVAGPTDAQPKPEAAGVQPNTEAVEKRLVAEAAGAQHHAFASLSVEDTKRMAALLAASVRVGDCIELSGDLGAGKTQFAQGLAAGLGVSAQVISPTFNILLTYSDGRVPLLHFDLYRLDDALELEDIGFYDALEDEGVVCIEWGDKFPEALPDDRLIVRLHSNATCDDGRLVELHATGARSEELRSQWEEALASAGGFSCPSDAWRPIGCSEETDGVAHA